jgi:hypothetical protein
MLPIYDYVKVDGVPMITVSCSLGYWYNVWLILNWYTSNICRDSNSFWGAVDWTEQWGLLWCNMRRCIGKWNAFNKTLPFWEDPAAGKCFCSYWHFQKRMHIVYCGKIIYIRAEGTVQQRVVYIYIYNFCWYNIFVCNKWTWFLRYKLPTTVCEYWILSGHSNTPFSCRLVLHPLCWHSSLELWHTLQFLCVILIQNRKWDDRA